MVNSVCAQCGTPADTGLIFCKKCGATLRPTVSLSPASSEAGARGNRQLIGRGSKFWLTWKEFVTVMSVLIALGVAVAFGGSGEDTANVGQALGAIGGIYIVGYIIRALRARDWD